MKRIWDKLLFTATLLFCSEALADINVAVITPIGGDYKYFSEELMEGAKIAIDEINNKGGLQGEKINMIPIDDPCDDVLSLSAAQMMLLNKTPENKIQMVLGPQCPNAADKIAEVLAKAQIIQIHPTSISRVRYAKPAPAPVRFVGYSEEQVKELMRFIDSHYPARKLSVIYNAKDEIMKAMADAISAAYAQSKNSANLVMAPYDKSTAVAVDQTIDAGAGIAYVMGDYKQIIDIAEKLKDNDETTILFVDRYRLHKKFARKVEALSEDSYIMSLPTLTNNSNFAPHLVRLRLWGIEPEGLMPYGYLSVKMWADAVQKAKSLQYDRVLSRLNNRRTDTGWGNVIYKDGVPDKSLPYTVYHIKNGKYTQVY